MQTLSKIFKKNITPSAGAILAFAIPFIIYIITLYPTVTTEDSGELITSAYFLGIGHPPGYPLYLLLAKLFTLIIPFGNIAWRVNTMSAFFGATTALLIYFFFKSFINSSKKSPLKNPLSFSEQLTALTPALLFSFLSLSWSQSIRAEVYTLHTALMTLVFLVAYLWHLNPKNNKLWYALCFSFGLGLTNHHMILVFAPILALFVIWTEPKILKNWKKILTGIGFFLLPLTIYLYLPIRSQKGPIDWGQTDNLNDIWRHISRADYKEITLPDEYYSNINFYSNPQITETTTTSSSFPALTEYLKLLSIHLFEILKQFFIVLALPLIAALNLKKQTKFKTFLLVSLVFYVALLPKLIDTLDAHDNFNPNSLPFLLPSILLTTILIGIGLNNIRTKFSKIPTPVFNIFLALIFLIPLGLNFQANNESNNYIAYDINKYILESLPENSGLYIPRDESHMFGFIYLQKIENINPTVTLYADDTLILDEWPTYNTFKTFHPDSRAFFIIKPPKDPSTLKLLPQGFAFELIPEEKYDKNELTSRTKKYTEEINQLQIRGLFNPNLDIKNRALAARAYQSAFSAARATDPTTAEKYLDEIITKVIPLRNSNITLIADLYTSIKKTEKAIEYLNIGLEQQPDNFEYLFKLGVAYQQLGDSEKSIQYFNKSKETSPKQFALQASAVDLKLGNCQSAFDNLLLIAKEGDIFPHIQAAECYIRLNQNEKAKELYNKALEILPEGSPAVSQIKNKIESLQ